MHFNLWEDKMPAAKLDIILEEGSDLSYEITYRDAAGDAIDVSGYGAEIIFADEDKKKLFAGDDETGDIQIGTTDGKITLSTNHEYYDNFKVSSEGIYQLYIYPTSGSPNASPKRLLEGTWIYSHKAKDKI